MYTQHSQAGIGFTAPSVPYKLAKENNLVRYSEFRTWKIEGYIFFNHHKFHTVINLGLSAIFILNIIICRCKGNRNTLFVLISTS